MDVKTLLAQLREERDALDVAISILERSESDGGPGDTLIIEGYLPKDGLHLIDGKRLTLSDGRIVDEGSADDRGSGDRGSGDTGPD